MLKDIHKPYSKPFLDKAFEPNGRPDEYPTPEIEDMLFFIQRNYNTDTIIYQTKFNPDGLICIDEPIKVFWYKYTSDQSIRDLNYLQKKLAYGYNSNVISNDLFEFEFVSYPKRFFLAKQQCGTFKVSTQINNQQSFLSHVYIYAEENGVFPDVKFIELFGTTVKDGLDAYEKINIE